MMIYDRHDDRRWSSHVRSYLDLGEGQRFAKDLRTAVICDLDAVLNGQIDDFLIAAVRFVLPLKASSGAAIPMSEAAPD